MSSLAFDTDGEQWKVFSRLSLGVAEGQACIDE